MLLVRGVGLPARRGLLVGGLLMVVQSFLVREQKLFQRGGLYHMPIRTRRTFDPQKSVKPFQYTQSVRFILIGSVTLVEDRR